MKYLGEHFIILFSVFLYKVDQTAHNAAQMVIFNS